MISFVNTKHLYLGSINDDCDESMSLLTNLLKITQISFFLTQSGWTNLIF